MTYREHRNRCTVAYFQALLVELDGNIAAVARAADVNRGHVYRLMALAGSPLSRRHNPGNAAWRALQSIQEQQGEDVT